jgi:predicted metal-dependent hydrolase
MSNFVHRGNEIIEYVLKSSKRARHIRIVVKHDASVVVTIPYKVGEIRAEYFVVQKASWILERIAYIKKNPQRDIVKHSTQEIEGYKVQALKLVRERLAYFNQFYKLIWNNISIKNTVSRWGSCSKKGNLHFNYKIVLLPPNVADYIIVHELCHLGEFNHSKNFWKLVAKTIPDYMEMRRELKKVGLRL